MKKALLLVVAAMLLVGTWSATARAEAGALSGEVGVDYASRYIWRGIDLINNNQPAIQPWFSLSYGLTDKLKVNYLFWADYRLVSGADPNDRLFDDDGDDVIDRDERDNDWDEFDHVVSLTYDHNDTFSFELGYILYYLPSLTNTQEVYAGATMALPYNLSTSLYLYYDFDDDTPYGTYAKWTVDYARELNEFVEVFSSVGLGYMSYSEGFDSGLADLPLTLGLNLNLGKGVTAKISANYSFALDALEDNDLNDDDEAWLMVGMAYAF